jgi:FixJ family two-component response regulator
VTLPAGTEICIVDDDEPIRRALARIFQAEGIEARGFASAESFLSHLATRDARARPLCLIVDEHLGGMSGSQLIEVLRQSGIEVGLVVISSHRLPVSCHVTLRKPFGRDVLLEAVHSVMRA